MGSAMGNAMGVVGLGGLGMRLVPCNGACDGFWDSGDGSARWLVAVLIGNVLDINVLAFWGDPAEAALDVSMLITAL